MTRQRSLAAFLFCFLLAVSSLTAGSLPLNELSADRYMQHVKFLASDELKGRGNGTAELEKAAEYIASQFRALGLKPAGDGGSFFQKFEITTGVEFSSKNALQVEGKSKQKDKDFLTMPISSSGSYEGPVVFAGYGITSKSLGWDDYAGIDVKDKVVVVFRHDPEEATKNSRFENDKTEPSTFVSKARNARQHGAKAILFITDPNNHGSAPDTIPKSLDDLETRDLSILTMLTTRAAVAPLFEKFGKSAADVQREIDSSRKTQSFEFKGSKVRVVTDVKPIRKTVRNVLASVDGTDSKLKSEWLVIGAHYDHLGMGDENHEMYKTDVGQIHHGADDNASGTAGVLELSRLIQSNKLKRSVLFMTFSGEELGLFGSSNFVNHPTVPLTSITAMINMDMIGRLETRALNVMGTGTSPNFKTWVEDANKDLGMNITLSNGGHEGSDHISFDGKHIPILFFFSGLHSDYHRPTDTADKIDSKGAIKVLSLAAGAAERIANAPAKLQYTEVKEDPRPGGAPGGGGSPYGTYFGSVPDFRDDLSGVLFADVRADSPAGKAGLKAGDLLVEFAGEPIKNLYDFTDALAAKKPGDVIAVTVKRGTQSIKVNVTLEARK